MRLLNFFYPEEWDKVDAQAIKQDPWFATIFGLVLLAAFLAAAIIFSL
jgi:hypothetical protein